MRSPRSAGATWTGWSSSANGSPPGARAATSRCSYCAAGGSIASRCRSRAGDPQGLKGELASPREIVTDSLKGELLKGELASPREIVMDGPREIVVDTAID